MTRLSQDEIRARVRELGQWFHDIDLGGVRTAPDHGTAFNIAGQAKADPRPTIAAIAMAARMATAREHSCAPAK